MGNWRDRERSVPNWEGTLSSLTECLEGVTMAIEFGKQDGVRTDILTLEALEQLDSFISGLKRDLGV